MCQTRPRNSTTPPNAADARPGRRTADPGRVPFGNTIGRGAGRGAVVPGAAGAGAMTEMDAAMLELFREEVRSHTATLSAGLLELGEAQIVPGQLLGTQFQHRAPRFLIGALDRADHFCVRDSVRRQFVGIEHDLILPNHAADCRHLSDVGHRL